MHLATRSMRLSSCIIHFVNFQWSTEDYHSKFRPDCLRSSAPSATHARLIVSDLSYPISSCFILSDAWSVTSFVTSNRSKWSCYPYLNQCDAWFHCLFAWDGLARLKFTSSASLLETETTIWSNEAEAWNPKRGPSRPSRCLKHERPSAGRTELYLSSFPSATCLTVGGYKILGTREYLFSLSTFSTYVLWCSCSYILFVNFYIHFFYTTVSLLFCSSAYL